MCAIGLVVGTAAAMIDPRLEAVHLPLVVTVIASAYAPIQFQLGRGSSYGVNLSESTLVALLIAAPTGVVPLIMGVGQLVTALVRRAGATKAAYNFGSDVLAAALALVAVRVVVPGQGTTVVGLALVAGVLGAALYQLVQLGLIAELVRRLTGVRPRETVTESARTASITVLFTTLLGAMLGLVASFDAQAAWLGPPLVLGLWVALRDLNAAADATHTSLHLHDVTTDLADASTGLDSAVEKIAATFSARAVLLRIAAGHDTQEWVHDASGGGVDDLRTAIAQTPSAGEPRLVDTSGHAVAVVAPIVTSVGTGHLVVAGTTAQWSERQVALVGTLATHLGAILRTLELLERVTAESAKLNDIIEAAGDGIALVDAEGTVLTWNPGMQLLTGVGPDAVGRPLGQVLTWREPEVGRRGGALPPALVATLEGRTVDPGDLEILRGERWRTARCRFSPVRGADGGVDAVVLVARDRTLEADLVQVKHDFVAIVSHEIRTPLTPLKGMVELLASRGDSVTPDVRGEMVGAMQRQLARLDALVTDLLTVADLDGGTLALVEADVDLDALCREVVEAEVPQEQRDAVELRGDGTRARVDRAAMQRILGALLSNAVKHGAPPYRIDVLGRGGQAVVEVRDHGIGIPPWEHAAVFERFRRVGTNLEWSTQGPGLGLAIADELATAMGCTIELESRSGEGACFRVLAPVAARGGHDVTVLPEADAERTADGGATS